MRFGSLFTGIGGFDLGFERAGMECAWQVEIDAACKRNLEGNFPGIVRHRDVKEVGKLDPVDLVCGGFPCQDLSVAGRREGLAGERSGLWFEFHRILAEMLPKWVVVENVPGLLSSSGGRDFAVLLRGLVELGYGVCWRVLAAQYYGVAQRRRRVFVVGHLGDGRAAQVLFEREGGAWDTPPSREKGQGTARTLDGKSASSDRGSEANELDFIVIDSGQAGAEVVRDGSPSLTGLHEQPILFTQWDAQRARVHDADGVAPALQSGAKTSGNNIPTIAFSAKDNGSDAGENAPTLPATRGHTAIAWHNKQQSGDVRIQGDTVNAVTQQWGTGGNNVPFVGVRRLTPTECERLQGFPDGWTAGQSDSVRYRQLGNAVCVPVIEWLGRRIVFWFFAISHVISLFARI